MVDYKFRPYADPMVKNAIQRSVDIEWPTIALIIGCYAAWVIGVWLLPVPFSFIGVGIVVALHTSLQHEIIHGHPFRQQWLNDLIIWPPLTLVVPFARFKTTHLAHHHDACITDPYDDPESNYLDGATWDSLSSLLRCILRVNNTILGRLLMGPLIGTVTFGLCEWRMRDKDVICGWLWHIPAVMAVLAVVISSPMPFWAYLGAAYFGLSVLKLRTFLEHQADDRASGRSVIIEKGGVLGFLFLNNNLHAVHHMHPRVAWYRLPALFRSRRDHYLRRNRGYYFGSYGEVIRRYLCTAKDPVAHPLWRR